MTHDPTHYINRELSWLEFNQRVLDEGMNRALPLIERLKFLAITSSNLDEFFMVRVGGLQLLSEQGSTQRDASGMTPHEQLQAINQRVQKMTADQYTCFLEEVEWGLAEKGIQRLQPIELSEKQNKTLEQVFDNEIYPLLTPMAVTADKFPLLMNQTLNICVRLEPTASEDVQQNNEEQENNEEPQPRYAVIPFGRGASRFITLPSEEGGYSYLLLEDAVSSLVQRFFPGESIVECVPFRVTLNADITMSEDFTADLLVQMQQLLSARKQTDCVRLEISDHVTTLTLEFLREALNLSEQQIHVFPGPLDLSAYFRLADLSGFDHLKDESWLPLSSPGIDPAVSMFDTIAENDLLLYHPYESFAPVVRFIEEAADDPDVIAIKQTLYRTSRNSPIVAALSRAAERGKSVAAIVELKARFDEARNIEWARNMEQAGVQVIYGVKGLKTHAKVCIIVRREAHGVRKYVHFGTGNYNESTARIYSDASYFTCRPDLGNDATSFFYAITGYSQPQQYRKIEAAPIGLRHKILEMIESETERKRQGQEAKIIAKCNSLVDPEIIEALYNASQAGVKIKLNIRGICCLRPGVAGLSENIEVISIIDRYLEHARIFYFLQGGDQRVFISSADWMPRNLDRRVELLVPIDDEVCRDKLIAILECYFFDTQKARRILSDGSYEMVSPAKNEKPFRSQQKLYDAARQAIKQEKKSQRTTFKPHRSAESE
ncbi:Polyphosphate kinase [hydrothermal vent metagenome]|uniref:ATP-polyphosphate phosphotransferase n=1 Tax=hydrothermal vent metagenome TaxID=652676 RepID=A0A3B1DVC2_9ZZZZ